LSLSLSFLLFSPLSLRPPSSTLFPYTTLFRSVAWRSSCSRDAARTRPGRTQRCHQRDHGGQRERRRVTVRLEQLAAEPVADADRSEEHTSELQSLTNLVCRLLLEKKKKTKPHT